MNIPKEEQAKLSDLIMALNAISTDKIYKTSGGNIMMRPKVSNDGNGWGDISIKAVLDNMKKDIFDMGSGLAQAKAEYIEFRQIRQAQEQEEIDAVLAN